MIVSVSDLATAGQGISLLQYHDEGMQQVLNVPTHLTRKFQYFLEKTKGPSFRLVADSEYRGASAARRAGSRCPSCRCRR